MTVSVAPVTEKTIRTRVVPATELARESAGGMPDWQEYIESLKPEEWNDHICYLYRDEPKATSYPGAPPAYLDKFAGTIEVRPGVIVPMVDGGTVQQAIKEKFGGRVFRLIIKKGKERVTEGRFSNETPPRYPDANSYFSNPNPGPPTAPTEASVASKAIDAMANQQPDAMRLAMEVLRNASDVVMRQANPPTNGNSSLIDQTIIQTLLTRALAPPPAPPDPFELFLRFKEILQPAQTNSVKDTLDLITTLKNSGLISSGGKTSLLDLGREVIPQVATTARDAIHEWRLGVEAQVRGVELTRGMNPPAPGSVAPQAQPVPAVPPAIGAPPAPAPAAVTPNGAPPFEWLAQKIVEILKESSFTVDEAVDETLSFLYRSYAPIVALLLDPPKIDARLAAGEQGLLMLFQNHPVLSQIPVNPRLVEYIKKFVAAAKEAEAARTAPAPAPEGKPA